MKHLLSLLITALIFSTSGSSFAGDGFLGSDLKTVQATDFFKFFCLKKAYDSKGDKPDEVRFNYTSQGEYKGLEMLGLVVGKSHHEVRKTLIAVTRKFIDDPASGVFAADFVKSFLSQGLSSRDAQLMGGLIHQISEYKPEGMKVIYAQPENHGESFKGSPKLIKANADGYRVFRGKKEEQDYKLMDCTLKIFNVEPADGEKGLALVIEPS